MKNNFRTLSAVLAGLLIVSFSSNASYTQTEEGKDGPRLEYKAENNRINLGTIYMDELEEVNVDIEFENTGNQPLILSNVRACCGTRVIEYTEEPVNPDEVGTIKVRFRLAPRPQNISRTVIVRSNDASGQKLLRIVGTVEDRK